MNRANEKLIRLNRMNELFSRLETLTVAELQELVDLMAPHPYPGINIAMPHERQALAAELAKRSGR